MIGRTVSHYRIISPLGSGGMGVVYLAEDARLGRQVALKFLPASWSNEAKALERFRVEARAASSLSHPAICAIYDIGQDGDTPFIVMEALKGETLRDRIIKGPLKVADVLDVGIQLADALDAAHTQGIVHRDIKPANIFLGDRNRVKVLDFGLAKLTGSPSSLSSGADTMSPGDRTKENPQITQPGTALGTVSYMSPEQARGEQIDSRTDLFSLGAVMYEMVTGVQAFGGSTTAVVYDAILNRAPRPIAHLNPLIPPRLEAVIATALEKDRELRYQHASDLQAELRRIRRDMDSLVHAGSQTVVMPAPNSAPAVPTPAKDPPKSGAGWAQTIAMVVAVLAIVIAVALFWRRQAASDNRAETLASEAPAISSAQPAGEPVSPLPPAEPAPAPAETPPAPAAPESRAAPEPVSPAAPPPRPRPAAPPEPSPGPRGSQPPPVTPPNPARTGGASTAATRVPVVTPSPTPPPEASPAPEGEKQRPTTTAPSSPVQPAPSQPAPSQPAPSQPAPSQPAPSQPAPSQPAPSQPAPSQPAPSQPAPSQPAPSQPAPSLPAPTPPRTAASPTPTPPPAAAVESDEAAIRRVIRTYEQAIETKDIGLYRSVRKNLTPADETVLSNSFRQIDSQAIDIRIESLRINGLTATARLARRDTLIIGGRRDVRNSTQTLQFEKTEAGWLIAE